MTFYLEVEIPKAPKIDLELRTSNDFSASNRSSAEIIKSIVENLPFSVEINLWGEEIYTEAIPIHLTEEWLGKQNNEMSSLVELFDVAYWPPGKAICLFFGPTPIGKKGEIKPYSPVFVIGKIRNSDRSILPKITTGEESAKATFRFKKKSID